jgi:hypothetical protein
LTKTNKQFGDHQEKQIVLEKVTFSEKFRAGFMIFQYSMKMKKKHSTSQQILQKHYKEKKWPKSGQKWPINSFLFVDVQRGMPNSSNKNFQKNAKNYVICMLVVPQSCLLILIL